MYISSLSKEWDGNTIQSVWLESRYHGEAKDIKISFPINRRIICNTSPSKSTLSCPLMWTLEAPPRFRKSCLCQSTGYRAKCKTDVGSERGDPEAGYGGGSLLCSFPCFQGSQHFKFSITSFSMCIWQNLVKILSWALQVSEGDNLPWIQPLHYIPFQCASEKFFVSFRLQRKAQGCPIL